MGSDANTLSIAKPSRAFASDSPLRASSQACPFLFVRQHLLRLLSYWQASWLLNKSETLPAELIRFDNKRQFSVSLRTLPAMMAG